MKRYNVIERTYGDGSSFMELVEDANGQFVEYEDIKHLIQEQLPEPPKEVER